MSTTRFGIVIGTALGAVWGLAGFSGALLTAFLAVVGFAVAFAADRPREVAEYLGRAYEDYQGHRRHH